MVYLKIENPIGYCIENISKAVTVRFLLLLLILFMGHAVTWLVEALCYKPEGCRFDSRCH
jgi:hypothetical protein